MSVALRSKASTAFATHTNPSVTAPSGVIGGDVLLMPAVTFTTTGGVAATPTPPAGWVALPGTTGGLLLDLTTFSGNAGWDIKMFGWTKVSAGSEPASYSVTQAAGSSAYWVGAYSGVDNTTPVSSSGGYTTNSGLGATSTALSVTPTVNGSGVVVVGMDEGDTTNNLSIAGSTPTFTNEVATPAVLGILDGTLTAVVATGNKTWTNNNSGAGQPVGTEGWGSAMIVLNAFRSSSFVPSRMPLGA